MAKSTSYHFYRTHLPQGGVPLSRPRRHLRYWLFGAGLIMLILGTGWMVSVVQAASVTIDSDMFQVDHAKVANGSDTVFVSDQVGYVFYRDRQPNSCNYRKTTDGGATWGTNIELLSNITCIKSVVWYDQWTPGDTTGNVIHILLQDQGGVAGTEPMYYQTLDTSSDTLSTAVQVNSTESSQFFPVSTRPYITKATDGTLYYGTPDAYNTSLYAIIKKCSANCTAGNSSWTNITPTGINHAQDEMLLMPLAGGDILFILQDRTNNTLKSMVYDSSAGTWDASYTTIDSSVIENTTYRGKLGSTIDRQTGDIYLSWLHDVGTLGTDDDIKTAVYSGGSWTLKTDVLTDSSLGITGAKIALDEGTGDIYAVYQAQTTPGTNTTGNVYYKKSTDGMTTWNTQSASLNSTTGDINGTRINIMSDERLYVSWQRISGTTGILEGETVADLTPPPPVSNQEQSSYRFYENVDSTTPGSPLAAQDTAATIAPETPFRMRQLLEQTQGSTPIGTDFKLQYAEKVGAVCTADASTDEVYGDLATEPLSTGFQQTAASIAQVSDGTYSWANLSNAQADDGLTADVYGNQTSTADSNLLVASDFGLSVPANAMIEGIEIRISPEANNVTFVTEAYVVKNGTVLSAVNPAAGEHLHVSSLTYGSSSFLWGTSWLLSDINNTGFGLAFRVQPRANQFDVPYTEIDYVAINVHYSFPSTDSLVYVDNAAPANAATITATAEDPTAPGTIHPQTYQETDPFSTVTALANGESGLWDFSLTSAPEADGKTYCFRVVKDDDSLLSSYAEIPEITFATPLLTVPLDQQLRGGQSVIEGVKAPFIL